MSPKKTAPKTAETAPVPSRVQQIADLDVGKSASFVERLDGDEATKEVILATRDSLLNTTASVVKRAKDKTGQSYTVENGTMTTRSLDIVVIVVVTRTA